jgi:hypothetical protein
MDPSRWETAINDSVRGVERYLSEEISRPRFPRLDHIWRVRPSLEDRKELFSSRPFLSQKTIDQRIPNSDMHLPLRTQTSLQLKF